MRKSNIARAYRYFSERLSDWFKMIFVDDDRTHHRQRAAVFGSSRRRPSAHDVSDARARHRSSFGRCPI